MTYEDKRKLEWCERNIPGFRDARKRALAARADTERTRSKHEEQIKRQAAESLRAMEAEVSF